MKLRLNRKLGKVNAKVFALCGFSIKSLTYLFFGLSFSWQLISAAIEIIIWGETFYHKGDTCMFIVMACGYVYFANGLGALLLDAVTKVEVDE